jgi:hypothetical protein
MNVRKIEILQIAQIVFFFYCLLSEVLINQQTKVSKIGYIKINNISSLF